MAAAAAQDAAVPAPLPPAPGPGLPPVSQDTVSAGNGAPSSSTMSATEAPAGSTTTYSPPPAQSSLSGLRSPLTTTSPLQAPPMAAIPATLAAQREPQLLTSSAGPPARQGRQVTVDDCYRAINTLHTQFATSASATAITPADVRQIKRAAEELRVEQDIGRKIRRVTGVFDANPDIDNEIAPWRFAGDCYAEVAKEAELAARWISENAVAVPGADTTIQGLRAAVEKCSRGSEAAVVTAQSIHVGAAMHASREFVASVACDSAAADIPGFANAGGVPKSVMTAFATYKKDRDKEREADAKRQKFNKQKKSSDLPTTECPKCHKMGHWRRDCPLLASSPAAGAKSG